MKAPVFFNGFFGLMMGVQTVVKSGLTMIGSFRHVCFSFYFKKGSFLLVF